MGLETWCAAARAGYSIHVRDEDGIENWYCRNRDGQQVGEVCPSPDALLSFIQNLLDAPTLEVILGYNLGLGIESVVVGKIKESNPYKAQEAGEALARQYHEIHMKNADFLGIMLRPVEKS
jgi:hypothetical protein